MEFVINLIRFPFSGSGGNYWSALGLRIHDHFIPHPRNNYHPHIFHHRLLGLFSAFLIALKIFTLALLAFGPVIPAFSSAITSQNVVSLTNESRKAYNLGTLTENSLLDKAAQAKASDMLAKSYFSHNTPDGKTPWDFILSSGYNYIMAGENLAVNFVEAENVQQAWMNSPSHRANILNKDFEEIGIGISQGLYEGHNAIFVVQMFGTPIEQKIQLAEHPTVVQTSLVPKPAVSQENSLASSTYPSSLVINHASSTLNQKQVAVKAQIPNAVKVMAVFGQEAVMLDPKPDNVWSGSVPLSSVLSTATPLRLVAYDLSGKATEQALASFAGSTVDSYAFAGQVAGATVSFLGRTFNPKIVESKVYLLFMASMLTSLVLAIAIRKHVQHLSLVANGSFVIILSALLFWAG